MEPIAVVTGADRGLGLALTAGLLERGWQVVAGQYMPDWPQLDELAASAGKRLIVVPLDVADIDSARAAADVAARQVDAVDMLINNAGMLAPTLNRGIREVQDEEGMHRQLDVNALGPLRVVEAFLPLLDRGAMKRLCFVSSEAGSINRCTRKAWYGYNMSKAALNMVCKILHNLLRPEGYTLRVYHPGWMRTYMSGVKSDQADMEPEEAAIHALAYFMQDLHDNPARPEHSEEDRLVMRDWQGREWPW
jgi:NAD(P)-dependent dehydrogenase (short-subunit alcohol dehydrogenase family)